MPRSFFVLALCLWTIEGVPSISAAEGRFTAVLTDGTRLAGAEINGWYDATVQPALDGRPLFDAANPVRTLRDESLPLPANPKAYVEFYLGDCLPGRAVAYRSGADSAFQSEFPHLTVAPDASVYPADGMPRNPVRVMTRWVRRVVWQRRGSDRYRPATVFCRDGRQVRFRSLRWSTDAVRLLTDSGTSELPIAQIAEIHMPQIDPWDLYFEQVAALAPDGAGMLLRLETTDGIRATASTQRFLARTFGSAADPEHWFHAVQPAWSLDPLWLPHRRIRLRRYSKPSEVPLSSVDVARVLERPMLGRGWGWQLDRNLQQGEMAGPGVKHAWGFGVSTYSELEFSLSACVKTLRTGVGLDAIAGSGGCARARIFVDTMDSTPRFESPLLVGASAALDTGPIELAGAQRLILVADPAHADRPAGADPFDIRDSVNWIEPQLELDPLEMMAEAARRSVRWTAAWQGWDADETGGVTLAENYWDGINATLGRFRRQVMPGQQFLTLSRSVQITPERDWLLVAASRSAQTENIGRLQVQVNGAQVAEYEVPVQQNGIEPDPLLVPLAAYLGREVTIGVVQLPAGERALVDWRALTLIERDPRLLTLLEDPQPTVAPQPKAADDGPAKAYSGSEFAQVSGSDPRRLALGDAPIVIRDNPALGQYRYVRFAWKKAAGNRICLELGHDGRWGPLANDDRETRRSFRFDAGTTEPSLGAALRIDGKLPEAWTVVTRDLFADFGAFNLTGLSLVSPDGEAAQFDHIYLGRNLKDFERIEVQPNPTPSPQ